MTPPLRRVFVPLAALAGGFAALVGALVMLAACRRDASVRPVAVEGAEARSAVLRVCADANTLPFSRAHGHGFDSRQASMQPRGRGEAQAIGRCDVITGVPAGLDRKLATRAD